MPTFATSAQHTVYFAERTGFSTLFSINVCSFSTKRLFAECRMYQFLCFPNYQLLPRFLIFRYFNLFLTSSRNIFNSLLSCRILYIYRILLNTFIRIFSNAEVSQVMSVLKDAVSFRSLVLGCFTKYIFIGKSISEAQFIYDKDV